LGRSLVAESESFKRTFIQATRSGYPLYSRFEKLRQKPCFSKPGDAAAIPNANNQNNKKQVVKTK